MTVTLSAESAAAMSNIHEVDVWDVGPTMVRGQGGKAKSLLEKKALKPAGPRIRVSRFSVRCRQKRGAKEKKTKAEAVAATCPEKPDASHYRRSSLLGKMAIQVQLKRLYSIHQKSFPSSPIFDVAGRCRMTFEGASTMTWKEICEEAPECISTLWLNILWQSLAYILRFHFVEAVSNLWK